MEWDRLGPIGTNGDIWVKFERIGTNLDGLGWIGADCHGLGHWKIWGLIEMNRGNTHLGVGSDWDKLGRNGIRWDEMGQIGKSWTKLGWIGTNWDGLGQIGTY